MSVLKKYLLEELIWENRPITYGIVQPGPNVAPDGVPLIRGKDYSSGKVDSSDLYHVLPSIDKPYTRSKVKADDILLSIVGYLGQIAEVPQSLEGANITQTTARISIDPKRACSHYLFYYFQTSEFRKEIRKFEKGSAQPGLNLVDVSKFEVWLPLITEQTKIAEILSILDRTIEQTETLIAKKQRIKTGLTQDLLTRGIDKHGNLRSERTHKFKGSPLGRIPVEWDIKTVGEFDIDLVDGDRGENYPKQSDLLEDGYCLFLSAKNVTVSGFRFLERQFITEEKDRRLGSGKLRKYDIVLTTRGTVGNFAFNDDNVPYLQIRVNSGMIILRNRDSCFLPEFIFEAFRNFIYEFEFKRIVSGSAQPQLPARDLKFFHMVRPSIEEQREILLRVNQLNQSSTNEENYLAKLRSIKAALMQDLLTGKKPVTGLLKKEIPNWEEYNVQK